MKIAVLTSFTRFDGIARLAYNLQEEDSAFTVVRLNGPRHTPSTIHELSRMLIKPITSAKKISQLDADGFLSMSSVEAIPAILGGSHPHGVMCLDFGSWRGWTGWSFGKRIWSQISRQYDKVAYSKSDVVFCVTEYVQKELASYLPRIDSKVVTPGLTSKFIMTARQLGGLTTHASSNRFNILMITGTLTPDKGIRPVIRALGIVRRGTLRSCVLTIVGWGTSRTRSYLKEECFSNGISLRILSDITDSQLMDEYTKADVFVEATAFEWFNFPPMEAMAFGVPVVYAFAMHETGIWSDAAFITTYDERALSHAISVALSDSVERAKHIQMGYRLINKLSMRTAASQIRTQLSTY